MKLNKFLEAFKGPDETAMVQRKENLAKEHLVPLLNALEKGALKVYDKPAKGDLYKYYLSDWMREQLEGIFPTNINLELEFFDEEGTGPTLKLAAEILEDTYAISQIYLTDEQVEAGVVTNRDLHKLMLHLKKNIIRDADNWLEDILRSRRY